MTPNAGGVTQGRKVGAQDSRSNQTLQQTGPEDVTKTVYDALGLPDLEATDREGRPFHLLPEGRALTELF